MRLHRRELLGSVAFLLIGGTAIGRAQSLPWRSVFRLRGGEAAERGRQNGNFSAASGLKSTGLTAEATMNGLIYLVGLIVVIMFILSFLGLR